MAEVLVYLDAQGRLYKSDTGPKSPNDAVKPFVSPIAIVGLPDDGSPILAASVDESMATIVGNGEFKTALRDATLALNTDKAEVAAADLVKLEVSKNA